MTTHFSSLAEAIARVPVVPCGGGSSALAGEQLVELVRLWRQLGARVSGHAHAFDRQGFAVADGSPSTSAWLRAHTRMEGSQAQRILASARTAEALPLLGKAFADGDVGPEHVEAIAGGAAGVPFAVLAEHESTLAEYGVTLRPNELRRVARRVRSIYDDEMVQRDAAYAHESRSLHLAESSNGIWYLNGQFEAEVGASLKAALDSLCKRLGPSDDRSAPQRRADAMHELTQLALRSGKLPDCGGDRPRLTLTVQPGFLPAPPGEDAGSSDVWRALTGLAGALTGHGIGAAFPASAVGAFGGGDAHLFGSDTLLPTETIQRIGCDADVNVAVQDWDGEVLNYGRNRRFPLTPLRRAVVLRDGGCVFPGCDRPPSMCEVHHVVYWTEQGGTTDIDCLGLACLFHHHLIHEGHWALERLIPGDDDELPGGGWRATAPDGRVYRRERRRAA